MFFLRKRIISLDVFKEPGGKVIEFLSGLFQEFLQKDAKRDHHIIRHGRTKFDDTLLLTYLSLFAQNP